MDTRDVESRKRVLKQYIQKRIECKTYLTHICKKYGLCKVCLRIPNYNSKITKKGNIGMCKSKHSTHDNYICVYYFPCKWCHKIYKLYCEFLFGKFSISS